MTGQLQYTTLQYGTVQYGTVQYSTVQQENSKKTVTEADTRDKFTVPALVQYLITIDSIACAVI